MEQSKVDGLEKLENLRSKRRYYQSNIKNESVDEEEPGEDDDVHKSGGSEEDDLSQH